ncbi:MAG: DUF3488 and DUF4129 domain-containing transglutaminase family protein [Haloferacaceae archaeon]
MIRPSRADDAPARGTTAAGGAGADVNRDAADANTAGGFRLLALAGVALLTFSYVSVLYRVTDVAGGSLALLALVGGALALAWATARLVRPRTATLVAAVLLVAGFAGYLLSVPPSQRALLLSGRIVPDTVALLTGLSVLRLTEASAWAMGVAPGPVFLSWYLAVRGRYVAGVAVGGVALGLFVLTGDAGGFTTLTGVVGAAAAVGLGGLATRGGTPAQVDTLTATLAAMVVVSASLSLVPSGAATPLVPESSAPTVESSLVEAEDTVEVLGSIRLSPEVRFVVRSPESRYWQTAAYDRYTGAGWVRTGEARPYEGRLSAPPGGTRPLRQRVTARTTLGALPAAWRPVEVGGGIAGRTVVTPQGGIRPAGTVAAGDSYTVVSRVPRYTTAQLRGAGTDYPDRIADAYRQVPGSTPDRVRRRASEVTADAESPYAAATAVEEYLESEKRYSLDVRRPEGDVADAFLFEMEAGYCTYYATTMVTMLRTQGIPARFVVGYTGGRQVDDGKYVVRGLDAHAWVQVYFPDVGWVNFDPTPAGPRRAAEETRVQEARLTNETGGAANESAPVTPTPAPDERNPAVENVTGASGPERGSTPAVTPAGGNSGADAGGGPVPGLPSLPSRRMLALWTIALAGVLAVGRRLGLAERVGTAVRLRYQGARIAPDADVVRAYDRLERLFARRYRPRAPGETPRAYVERLVADGADERALPVVEAYERARYGDGVDRAAADAAVDAVDRLTREATPVVRRFVR